MIPISDDLARELNLQVTREMTNRNLYLMFASWCHVRGLKNIEKFFKKESDGEWGHANLLMDILSDANVQIDVHVLPVKPDPKTFVDCKFIAETYRDAEVETTDFLDALYSSAEKQKNVGVSNLLQGMLQEQVEEQGLTERFYNLVMQANGNLIELDLVLGE
jgi:ferritin